MKRSTMLLTAAVAMVAAATPVSAMQDATVTIAMPAPPNERVDRARELKAQAEALYATPKQWRKAAKLLEQSAAMRDANDPEAYTCFVYAGRIQAAIGDLASAQKNLEQAAAQALARGAIVDAAHAYIDAAHVSAELKQRDVAKDFVQRATLLSESPLLTAAQRESLTARITA